MLTRLAVLFSFLLCTENVAGQIRLDTIHFGNPDTLLIRRFSEDGQLLYETFKLNRDLVKTRQYYYADTVFGYTEMGIQFWTTRWFEFYPDSTCRIAATFVDEKLDGRYQKYYSDGKPWCDYLYREGKRNGVQKEYHKNGRLSCTYTCVNDRLEGQLTRYDEAGTVREVGTMRMDDYHDTVRFYHANGQLSSAMWYDHGFAVEAVCSYDAAGNPRKKGTLSKTYGTVYVYSEEGKLECIDYYWRGIWRWSRKVK